MAGQTDAEKSETVGNHLTNHNHTTTYNLSSQEWIQSSGPVSSSP
jgi:hypothetical protein